MTTGDGNGVVPLDRLFETSVIVARQQRGRKEVLFLADRDDPAVVKFVAKLTTDPSDDPRASFDLHAAIVRHGAGDCVPRPIAWGDDPRYFAYEYVDGESVKHYIERAATDPSTWLDELASVGSMAGSLLAKFHGCFEAPADPVISHSRVLELSRRMIGAAPDPAQRMVRTLGDSGPHNLVIGGDGHMTMIDLDTRERWTSPEADIGVLAHRIARRAANAQGSWKPSRQTRRVLIGAVIDGYSQHASGRPSIGEVLLAFGASSLVFGARTLRVGPDWSIQQAGRDTTWWLAAQSASWRLSRQR